MSGTDVVLLIAMVVLSISLLGVPLDSPWPWVFVAMLIGLMAVGWLWYGLR